MKKIFLILILMLGTLTGCGSNKKYDSMNADYKSTECIAYNDGTEYDANSNGGVFMTVTNTKNVEYRGGKTERGTITATEVNGNEIKFTVSFPDDTVYDRSYLTYSLDNPDQITLTRIKGDSDDVTQATDGFVAKFVKKAEGEPDRIILTTDNDSIYVTKKISTDTSKSKTIKIKNEQVMDVNGYNYLQACNGYDSICIDITITGRSGYEFENAVATVTVSGEIMNPWATLESLGCKVSSKKKKTKTVSVSEEIVLDAAGNGSGTVTVPCFGSKLNLSNCITDYDLSVSYSYTGTVIRKQ